MSACQEDVELICGGLRKVNGQLAFSFCTPLMELFKRHRLAAVAIGHIDPDLISECVVYIVPCVLKC